MNIDKLDRNNRRVEIKRLEELKADFMREYGELCMKYQAELAPVLGYIADNTIRVGLGLDKITPINPVNWFLNGKEDVRSSFYLEDVATEFQVQGLELDWACITWDGDLRYSEENWRTFSFVGTKWQNIHNEERKKYSDARDEMIKAMLTAEQFTIWKEKIEPSMRPQRPPGGGNN